tara:strand:- start:706 stop:1170 length:465 start_codon:yes stop_codon:yes gene_type:complete
MSKDWEKSFWETFKIYAGNQSEKSKLHIHTSDTHLLVFANPYCPDSLDFSNNVTSWVNHHNKKMHKNLDLKIIDIKNNGGALLTNNLKENGNRMKYYDQELVDTKFYEHENYYYPQFIIYNSNKNKIKDNTVFYQHHSHTLKLTCTDPKCRYCV